MVETVEPDQLQPSGEPLSVRSGAFRALRHRNYRLYFFGQLVSLAGTWMQSAAQAWLVLKLTNSSMMLGVVSFAQFTPILLVGLFAGVLVDRVDRRRLIITTQFMLMMSAFTLAALTWTGTVRVEHVIMLAAFNGAIGSFDMPGRQSFVVEMVGYDDLANAIALNSMMFNSARMLGPAAAGLLIAYLGIGTCFFLNGVSFLAVIWSLFQMQIPRARDYRAVGTRMFQQLRWKGSLTCGPTAPTSSIRDGAGRGDQRLSAISISCWSRYSARNVLHGDARTYGFLVAIQGLGLGAGCGDDFSRRAPTTRGIRNNLIGGLFISAIGIVVVRGCRDRWCFLMLAQLVIGAGPTNFRASNNTAGAGYSYPTDLRGRVMSTYQLAAVGMTPIGALEVGYMGTRLTGPDSSRICGAINDDQRPGSR